MPDFLVTGPDGKKYRVSGQGTAEEALAHVQSMNAPQEASWGETALDVAKALPSGIARGTAALAGLPGDVNRLVGKGVAFANDAIFGARPPEERAAIEAARERGNILPTTEGIKQAATDVTGMTLPTPQTRAGRYAHTAGEFIPASLMGPGGALRNVVSYGVVPGLTSEAGGEAASAMFGPAYEAYGRIAGAIAGGILPSIVGKAVRPNQISPERQRSVDTLRSEGVDVTAGQATGRRGLRFAETEIGGNKAANIFEKQGEQFTKAALKRVGENAKRATPEVMERAYNRIGGEFDRLAGSYTMRWNQQFGQKVADALTDYHQMVPPAARSPVVQNIADDILQSIQANPQGMPGTVYQGLRSRLGKMASTAIRRDPDLGDALFRIQDALDDAMQRSITSPADKAAWATARKQYRNFLTLEKSMAGAGEKAASGLVSPAQLRTSTAQQGRRAYVQGKGDFADLARSGVEVMLPPPDSGTASRLAARGLPTFAGTVLGGQLSGGDIMGMLAGAAGGQAANRAAGSALMSRPVQSYLMSGIPLANRMAPTVPGGGLGALVNTYNAALPLRTDKPR